MGVLGIQDTTVLYLKLADCRDMPIQQHAVCQGHRDSDFILFLHFSKDINYTNEQTSMNVVQNVFA